MTAAEASRAHIRRTGPMRCRRDNPTERSAAEPRVVPYASQPVSARAGCRRPPSLAPLQPIDHGSWSIDACEAPVLVTRRPKRLATVSNSEDGASVDQTRIASSSCFLSTLGCLSAPCEPRAACATKCLLAFPGMRAASAPLIPSSSHIVNASWRSSGSAARPSWSLVAGCVSDAFRRAAKTAFCLLSWPRRH